MGMTNNRKYLQKIAAKKGIMVSGVSNWHQLADRLEHYFGVGTRGNKGPRNYCFDIMESRGWIKPKPEKSKARRRAPKAEIRDAISCRAAANSLRKPNAVAVQSAPVSVDQRNEFYNSLEWKEARDKVLAVFGRSCVACGRSDGVTIHVDHIRPVKYYWSLRLDLENLQPVCASCNRAKGSKSEIDLRPMSYARALKRLTAQFNAMMQ